PASAPTLYKRILCAVDLTEKSVALMRWAAQIARHFQSTLHLVHAIPGADGVDTSFQSFLFSAAREKSAKLQQEAGIALETCVAGGEVGSVVREAAERHRDDLVVIGRGRLTETLGRLRTNAYSIIRQSPCPVISV